MKIGLKVQGVQKIRACGALNPQRDRKHNLYVSTGILLKNLAKNLPPEKSKIKTLNRYAHPEDTVFVLFGAAFVHLEWAWLWTKIVMRGFGNTLLELSWIPRRVFANKVAISVVNRQCGQSILPWFFETMKSQYSLRHKDSACLQTDSEPDRISS